MPSGSTRAKVCCAGSRLLLHEGIAAAMVEKLKRRMEKLRVGDPLDKAVDIGAIVAPVQLERIERLVARGVEEGATLWQPSWACPSEGYFYPPTLLTDVEPAATVANEEIFGPVLAAMAFRTPADAVALANNTRYGLAASVWSENIGLALDIAPQIKSGVVWINATTCSTPRAASAAIASPASAAKAVARACGRICGRAPLRRRPPPMTRRRPPVRWRARPRRPPSVRSIAPPRCISAAARCGPIPATAAR